MGYDYEVLGFNAKIFLDFQRVLSDFNKNQVEELLFFHKANDGLFRYLKFRYLFEEIRKE